MGCLLVLAHFQVGITQDAIRLTITRVERNGLGSFSRRGLKVVPGGKDVGQMTDDPTVPWSKVERFAECLFSTIIIAQVTALTGLLDIGVAEVKIRRGIVRIALELALCERNGMVGI